VLITVTEMRGGSRSDVRRIRSEAAESNTMRSAAGKTGGGPRGSPGVIRDCGGHLWMKGGSHRRHGAEMRLHNVSWMAQPPALDGPWFRH